MGGLNGRVGYVHIPDMGAEGYAEFHRLYLTEYDHEALIVHVRWNGGGYASALILEKLARRRRGYGYARWGGATPYPEQSPRGPLVMLTNELAGSDGDIVSHSFKMMGLGPLIGKRTWGGVIGITPRHALVDNTITTQPEYAFCFDDVGWGVENYGTDPDIEVEYTPQDYAAGRDPQLTRGIEEAMRLLAAHPAHTPQPLPRPRLGKATAAAGAVEAPIGHAHSLPGPVNVRQLNASSCNGLPLAFRRSFTGQLKRCGCALRVRR